MVCSVSASTTAGAVTVIPFTNTYTDETSITQTNELVVLGSADWLWKITLVVGADRNMFEVGFYPV